MKGLMYIVYFICAFLIIRLVIFAVCCVKKEKAKGKAQEPEKEKKKEKEQENQKK